MYVVEYPCAGGDDVGVGDAAEAVDEVVGDDASSVVEVYVVAEGEGVVESVAADGPVFGDGWLYLECGVEFDESVVELPADPDDALVFGEGGVEGGDAGAFVVAEYHFVRVVAVAA